MFTPMFHGQNRSIVWTPPNKSDLYLWVNADTNNITLSGEAVLSMTDLSGNGHDISYNSGYYAALYTGFNGKNAILIPDGADYRFSVNTFNKNDFEIFAVMKYSGYHVFEGAFFLGTIASDDTRFGHGIGDNTANGLGYIQFHAGGNDWCYTDGNPSADEEFIYGARNQTIYKNGYVETLYRNDAISDNFTLSKLYYDDSYSGGTGLVYIAELLIYKTTLSADDRKLVNRYLGNKYGISTV